jgi:sRNA-binding protein
VLQGPVVPLAIGIHTAFQEALEPGQEAALAVALRWHTSTTGYLDAMLCDHPRLRYDAEGKPAGEVADNAMRFAAVKLEGRLARDRQKAAVAANRSRGEMAARAPGRPRRLAARFPRRHQGAAGHRSRGARLGALLVDGRFASRPGHRSRSGMGLHHSFARQS